MFNETIFQEMLHPASVKEICLPGRKQQNLPLRRNRAMWLIDSEALQTQK